MEKTTLAAAIARHARTRPDAVALVGPDGTTRTWEELNRRAAQVANALRAAGIGHGDRVGHLDKNDPTFFEIALGCNLLGAVVVGMNWRLAPRELEQIAANAGLALLLTAPEFEPQVPSSVRESCPVITMGEEYEQWVRAAANTPPEAEVSADDVVYQLYSSGTTGLPKGTLITSANLLWTLRAGAELYGMDSSSVNLLVSPLFHIGGAGYGLTAIGQGGTTVVARDLSPANLLRLVAEHRVTHSFLVPALVQMLIEAPEVATTDLSSLRLIAYGGAPMSEALLRRAMDVLGCEFVGVYGSTETSGTVIHLPPRDHVPALLRSIGRPLPWVDVRVVDPATGEDVGPDVVGELWVRSPTVTPGYWRQPETTAEALVADGWLRTGDAVYRNSDGFLFLHDRIKDMVISGGENVYPAEVENVLAEHPAIAQVAVIGVPSQKWGETVKAVVVARPGATVDAQEIIAFCRERLAHYKCPTSVDVVDELPRNASGKLLKKELRRHYWPAAATAGA